MITCKRDCEQMCLVCCTILQIILRILFFKSMFCTLSRMPLLLSYSSPSGNIRSHSYLKKLLYFSIHLSVSIISNEMAKLNMIGMNQCHLIQLIQLTWSNLNDKEGSVVGGDCLHSNYTVLQREQVCRSGPVLCL